MARAARNKSVSALHVLLLLLACARAAGRNAPSFRYNFNVTTDGHPWCKFEGQINRFVFLHYTCSQKAKCHFYPRKTGGYVTCKGEEETLKDLTEKCKKILSKLKSKSSTISGFPTLMGKMTCQLEDNGPAYESFYLHIDGIKVFHFDSRNVNGTPLNSEDGLLNVTLKNDEGLTDFLRRNSAVMCKIWYEKLRNHGDNVLNRAAPVTSEPTTEPPTSASATDQSKNVNIVNIVCIIVGILISLIIPRSCVLNICRKRRRRQPAGQEAPSGDCVGQDEEASFLQTPEIPGEPSCSQSRDSQLPADWGERSTERLCLEQRPATQTGSAVSCISL